MHVPGAVMAIAEHERGDAERIEPLGKIVPLLVDREMAVAAARADDDGRLGDRGIGGGLPEIERRLVGGLGGRSARRAVFPEWNGGWLGGQDKSRSIARITRSVHVSGFSYHLSLLLQIGSPWRPIVLVPARDDVLVIVVGHVEMDEIDAPLIAAAGHQA